MTKQHMRVKVLTAVLIIVFSWQGLAQTGKDQKRPQIVDLRAFPGFESASIGIAVKDAQTGEMIYETTPMLSLAPASVLKLITTATALEMLGPDFRFQTTLAARGTISNYTLWGDLQIIGGGDPTLGSVYFPENNHFMEDCIMALQQKNIDVVKGKLVMDGSAFEPQTIPDTWIWEDIGNYYGAGVSAINTDDNQYLVRLSSGKKSGEPTRIEDIFPKIPGLEIHNEVLSSTINRDMAYIYGSPMDNKRVIRGTIPMDRNNFIIKGAVPDPAALLAQEFRKELIENKIDIVGETEYKTVKNLDSNVFVLAIHHSEPLWNIIRVTNINSVNLFAEGFLKQLAFKKNGLGSTEEGCKLVTEFWKEKGIELTGFFLCDGSGLSRFNAVTASQMVNILHYMKTRSQWGADFYNSLATAGDGTLTALKSSNFPNQSLRAKSGSMTRVRCMAGYLTTKSGRQLSYAILLNNFSCSQGEAIRKIEEVLVELRKM